VDGIQKQQHPGPTRLDAGRRTEWAWLRGHGELRFEARQRATHGSADVLNSQGSDIL
jgi:hypothetical protein